jgi:hypothetical protein
MVEKSGNVRFVPVETDLLGEFPGQIGHEKGLQPELEHVEIIEANPVRMGEEEGRDRNVPDGLGSENVDGPIEGFDLPFESEKRGVGQLEDLCGNALVMTDDFTDLVTAQFGVEAIDDFE